MFLLGGSYATSVGPDLVDIAFFVVIENAIKYAYKGSEVQIEVHERDRNIVVSVNSWGPCIADNERKKIFERGVRGAAAQRYSKDGGAGIGLFAASTIVREHFKGDIEVRQSNQRQHVDGYNYYSTSFILSFPIFSQVEAPTKARPKYRRNLIRNRMNYR